MIGFLWEFSENRPQWAIVKMRSLQCTHSTWRAVLYFSTSARRASQASRVGNQMASGGMFGLLALLSRWMISENSFIWNPANWEPSLGDKLSRDNSKPVFGHADRLSKVQPMNAVGLPEAVGAGWALKHLRRRGGHIAGLHGKVDDQKIRLHANCSAFENASLPDSTSFVSHICRGEDRSGD